MGVKRVGHLAMSKNITLYEADMKKIAEIQRYLRSCGLPSTVSDAIRLAVRGAVVPVSALGGNSDESPPTE